jgi:flagellar motor protein MotB
MIGLLPLRNLTNEDLEAAGLGGKVREACPQAPAPPAPSSALVQQSRVLAISPSSALELRTTPVVISGNFVERVIGIKINGAALPAGSWTQNSEEISFEMPAKSLGLYVIQIDNGVVPSLRELNFTFILAAKEEMKNEIFLPKVNQGSDTSTATIVPDVKKPLQKTLKTKIFFNMGSSALNASETKKLRSFARLIAGLGSSIKISVTGYAQPTPGSERTDQALSKRRASSVAIALQRFGVNTKVIYAGAGRTLINKPTSRYVEIVADNK